MFHHVEAGDHSSQMMDQVNFLCQEAQRVLVKTKRDDELNHSACNPVRRPRQTYYHYERQSAPKYLSIMHRQDWLL